MNVLAAAKYENEKINLLLDKHLYANGIQFIRCLSVILLANYTLLIKTATRDRAVI